MPRRVMPVFFQPPEGTREHERAGREDERKKALKRKFNNEQISIMKNPNISHMGPPSSGINLENFVLIYKSNENPLSVLNTSSMFCKMGVDFYFEEIPTEAAPGMVKPVDNWICTAFVEGEAVADGKGVKKTLKQQVAVSVLECLGKICYSVLMEDGLRSVNQNNLMSRRDVKTTGESSAEGERLGEDNVGNKMLQLMGWREGEGLGRGGSIVDPIKVEQIRNYQDISDRHFRSEKIYVVVVLVRPSTATTSRGRRPRRSSASTPPVMSWTTSHSPQSSYMTSGGRLLW